MSGFAEDLPAVPWAACAIQLGYRHPIPYGEVRRSWERPPLKWSVQMARVCEVTGKGPMTGNNVSHANNRTKRRFEPNLQSHRFWVPSEGRWVRLRVTPRGIKTIDKLGIESVLAGMRARGEKV